MGVIVHQDLGFLVIARDQTGPRSVCWLENLFLTIMISHSFSWPLCPIAWVSFLLAIWSRTMAVRACAVRS